MKTLALFGAFSVTLMAADLRLGIIGTDTSHATAFTKILNDSAAPDHVPGARVIAAYKGANPFASVKLRLGEIPAGNPNAAGARPVQSPREITPVWESVELSNASDQVAVPAGLAKTGHTYRARARMKDATGRWSHWSAPVEFVAR